MSPDEVNDMPLYLAYVLMGAMSRDHIGVRMSLNDFHRYYGWKRKRI